MTILLIYCPPKQNSVFISEMHNLLKSLYTTSAIIIILGDFNIHVNTLVPHVDVPTHFRDHTLDLVISNLAPISNLLVYELSVSDQ